MSVTENARSFNPAWTSEKAARTSKSRLAAMSHRCCNHVEIKLFFLIIAGKLKRERHHDGGRGRRHQVLIQTGFFFSETFLDPGYAALFRRASDSETNPLPIYQFLAHSWH